MTRRTVIAAIVVVAVLLPGVASANPSSGQQFGRVVIPVIGITLPLFEGDKGMCQGKNSTTLNRGVSHYPCSAFPWEIGTVMVAGHRTTHIAPFRRLDRLQRGDQIKVQTRRGPYLYEVQRLKIVSPDAIFNIEVSGRLLLSTCYPTGSDRYRLIVVAKEVKQS